MRVLRFAFGLEVKMKPRRSQDSRSGVIYLLWIALMFLGYLSVTVPDFWSVALSGHLTVPDFGRNSNILIKTGIFTLIAQVPLLYRRLYDEAIIIILMVTLHVLLGEYGDLATIRNVLDAALVGYILYLGVTR
jgi:hypothetical protein